MQTLMRSYCDNFWWNSLWKFQDKKWKHLVKLYKEQIGSCAKNSYEARVLLGRDDLQHKQLLPEGSRGSGNEKERLV